MTGAQIQNHMLEEGTLNTQLDPRHQLVILVTVGVIETLNVLLPHIDTRIGLKTEETGIVKVITTADKVVGHVHTTAGIVLAFRIAFDLVIPTLHRPVGMETPAQLTAIKRHIIQTVDTIADHVVIVKSVITGMPTNIPITVRNIFSGHGEGG